VGGFYEIAPVQMGSVITVAVVGEGLPLL